MVRLLWLLSICAARGVVAAAVSGASSLSTPDNANAGLEGQEAYSEAVPDYSSQPQRAQAVKEAFQYAWRGYHSRAWGHDELTPVSGGFEDSR